MRRIVSCLFASFLAAGVSLVAAPAPARAASTGSAPASQEAKSKLTKAERAHVRRIVRDGKANGLTKAQIRAKVDAYLESIGKKRHEHAPKPKSSGVQ